MTDYLPGIGQIADLAITGLLAFVLLLVGSRVAGTRAAPEIRIIAAWGALCLILTFWGVFLPLSLRLPALGFLLVAALGAFAVSRRDLRELAVMLGLGISLWLVMATIRPAEPDTWLNLLPNAMYLVDWNRLPTAALPPSYSFLPAAPYNTQFLSYLGGLLDPDYPAPGMSLVNLLLLLVGGSLVARMILGDESPVAARGALGLLAATVLNPGFVPRIHLAQYGETGLAVTALAATVLFAQAQTAHREGRTNPGLLVPTALVLAAMVNIKQSGFGLVAAVTGAGLIASFCERAIPVRKAIAFAAKAVIPSVVLYLVWRYFVATAGVDELKPLPFTEWQWGNLPAIFVSIGQVAVNKGFYFVCLVVALAVLPILLRLRGWTFATRFLVCHALLVLLYNLFLVLTYIGHFPGEWSIEAHSYFRYETHLSLVLVLALGLALRDLGLGRWFSSGRAVLATRVAVALALLLPLIFVQRIRFDLDPPQPAVWALAKNLVPYLKDQPRLAALLPGDNGSVATMLGGVLRDTVPRIRDLDLLALDGADQATLDEALAHGYDLALISCTSADSADLPPQHAVLLRRSQSGWQTVASWPYPDRSHERRWQHILAWSPLCRPG